MKIFLQILLFHFLFFPLSSSASNLFGSVKVQFDDEIDKQTRSTIQALNHKILQSFKTNSPEVMYDIFTEKIKEQGIESIEKLYQSAATTIVRNEFHQNHEFLALHSGGGDKTAPISSNTQPEFLAYVTLISDIPKYVSIMESRNGLKDMSLFFIYEQIGDAWRLNTFQVGIGKFGGKTSVDWFHDAQQLHKEGHVLPAFLRLAIALKFLRPAPFIHYKAESDIREFESQCRIELEKHSYPITLNTKPVAKLISVGPHFHQGEVIPVAKYLSQIPLAKEEDIQAEAKTLVVHLATLFPGFSSHGQHVAFRAFNELPSEEQKSPPSFDVLIPVTENKDPKATLSDPEAQ